MRSKFQITAAKANSSQSGLALCLSFTLALSAAPVLASHADDGSEKKNSKHHLQKDSESAGKGTGLDAETLHMANLGDWKDVAARLESRVDTGDAASRDAAWLAFTYLYLSDCGKLSRLAERARSVFDARGSANLSAAPVAAVSSSSSSSSKSTVTTTAAKSSDVATAHTTDSVPASSDSPKAAQAGSVQTASEPVKSGQTSSAQTSSVQTSSAQTSSVQTTSVTATAGAAVAVHQASSAQEINAVIVQAYNEICATHFKDAEAELALLPTWFRYDALVNFTFAVLAGKEGRSIDAIDYIQRSVGAAPEFAWGYRTLGKLQQNRLKDLSKAEESYQAALAIQPDMSEVADTLTDIRLSKNNFDGAIDVADLAIKTSPHDAGNYYRLAQIYIQQWRLREALTELGRAIAIDANQARFYRSRATVKRYQGALNDAIADQQKAVDLGKDKPFELVELATMNLAAGNTNRAADNLQEAVKAAPNNQEAHDRLTALLTHEKRYDDLVTELQRFAVLKPTDARAKMALAKALLAQGSTDKAIQYFKEVANLDPRNPEPHRELGALRLHQEDYAGAVREYTNALNINPSPVPDLVALGYAYAENDDYAQAETAFVTALALQQLTQPNTLRTSPERLNLMRALAVLLMDEGRYSEAAAQFEAIHAMSKGGDQDVVDAFRLCQAKALRDLSTSAAQAAMAAFNSLPAEQQSSERLFLITTLLEANKPDLVVPIIEAAEKNATNTQKKQLLISRARALMLQGKSADARTLVANFVPDSTDPAEVSDELVNLSRIAVAANDLVAADALATKAIEKYPKNYNAYIQVGKISLKQGKITEAINFAKKALDLNQYSTRAYLLLGDAQVKGGNFKEASESYRHAAELYPGLLEAHRDLLETLRKLSLKDEVKREEEQIVQMEKLQ